MGVADYREINKDRKFANQEILTEVSEELGISEELIKSMIESQSEFIHKVIRTGAFENVILPYLGKIKVNPRKVQIISSKQQKL